MNIKVIIKNNDVDEIINVYDASDKNKFSYIDSYGANNIVHIKNGAISILRNINTHKTFVYISNEESYIRIISNEGELKFDLKVLAFIIEESIITIAYSIEDVKTEICIKYI